jgi:hypothetical protein
MMNEEWVRNEDAPRTIAVAAGAAISAGTRLEGLGADAGGGSGEVDGGLDSVRLARGDEDLDHAGVLVADGVCIDEMRSFHRNVRKKGHR